MGHRATIFGLGALLYLVDARQQLERRSQQNSTLEATISRLDTTIRTSTLPHFISQ
jgi:hypothetical protein